MGRPPLSEEENRNNKIKLINAAKEIMIDDGISAVSVRSISKLSGINGAIVYRYFQDADELILYASLDLLNDYNLKLYDIKGGDPKESYLKDWTLFCESAFPHAEYIYNLYFGKYSYSISKVLANYFDLFPQSEVSEEGSFSELMYMDSIWERNLKVLMPVLQADHDFAAINIVNNLTVSYFRNLLQEKISRPETDVKELTDQMLSACELLLTVK